MTYCAALPNWLHLVPLWENVIGLLLMREFWGELIWRRESAPGGKVTHWQVFFQPATNWDIQAGRAKRRETTTLILLRSLFQCRPPSSTKSEIAKCDAMTQVFIQECFTALTLNIEYITSQDVTLKLILWNLGFTGHAICWFIIHLFSWGLCLYVPFAGHLPKEIPPFKWDKKLYEQCGG